MEPPTGVNRRQAVSRFPTQVMMTYEEISQDKPYGEIAGLK